MSSSSLQALLDKRNNWSLAEDRQLCGVLEEISSSLNTKIISATDAIQKNALKIANTCVQVSNLNNRLSSFAADQFIESRVGDEAVVCAKPISTSQLTSPNKHAEVTDNLRSAVAMGLELMRTRFKRIDMRPEDFDEDDDPTFMPEPIFEPYDESLSRPLPFLIGTSDWNSSSCAGTSEEYAEATKVSEEVVISLPPFAQPRLATSTDSSQSNPLAEKTAHGASSRATSSASSSEGFGTRSGNYSHEYDNRTYTRQEVIPSSSSQTSLQKEAVVEKVTDDLFSPLIKEVSRRYPEVPTRHQDPAASTRYPDPAALSRHPDPAVSTRHLEPEVSTRRTGPEAPIRRPEPEVSTRRTGPEAPIRRPEPEVPVRRSLTPDSFKDQSKSAVNEDTSKARDLFADSSDEDDLFSELRNTSTKPKKYDVPVYTDHSRAVQLVEPENDNIPKVDMNVRESSVFSEGSQSRNPLFAIDDDDDAAAASDTEETGTTDAFKKKLDGIISNKRMPKAVNGVEKHQVKEDMVQNEVNAVLPSLAKLRAKGPPRRSPSRVLQQSPSEDVKEEVKASPSPLTKTADAEEKPVTQREVEVREERRTDSGRRNLENMNSVKEKSDFSSIFSSDSDDDIFAISSTRPKTSVTASNTRLPQDKKLQASSVPVAQEHPSATPAARVQAAKTGLKSKNLFDSDDDDGEDIFAGNIPVKKQQQPSAGSAKESVSGRNVRKTAPEIISRKSARDTNQEEVVYTENLPQAIPEKKPSVSKPKRVDIFGDDSDDDDLFK